MTTAQPDPIAFKTFEQSGWQHAAMPYHNFFENVTRQAIEPLLDAVQAKPGMRLLDVATGPGYVAAAAAQRGMRVVGVDFSTVMLEQARRQYLNIEFHEGDAESLPFPNQSFDAVVINFGMLHFAQPEQALVEAHRVLQDGGRIAFTVWAKPEQAIGLGIVLHAIQQHGNTNVPLPPGPPFFRFSDHDECKRVLRETGFINPQVTQVPQVWRLPLPDGLFDAFYEGTARIGPLLRAQAAEALETIRAAMREATKAYERAGMVEVPMPAVLALAIKP